MDIDCAILVKVGFGGTTRNAIRLILCRLKNDLADRGINLAWNTEYDWIYDESTPGSTRRWSVEACGHECKKAVKAAAEARIEYYVKTGNTFLENDVSLDVN